MQPALAPAPGPAGLVVSLGQHSERGRKALNQDFLGASLPAPAQRRSKGVVLALADGISSSEVSQVASQAAVRSALEDYYCTSDAWSVRRAMHQVLAATNAWLHAQTRRSPYREDQDRGYVCAMSTLVLKGRSAHLFQVGDTRIYRRQGEYLEQLTEDHRVWVGGGQSYLSRAMGFQPQLDLDYRCLPVAPGDLFVLASDGVYEHTSAADLLGLVDRHANDLDAAAQAIVALAMAQGSADNLSVQLLRVDSLPEPEASEAQRQRAGLTLPPLLRPRQLFDGYRIERELHGSSRSHLYLATALDSGEAVALKIPAVDLAQDEAALNRFVMEEWIARRIDSPHVLQAHSPQRPRSHLYSVMEYLPGQTLAQWQRDHPAPDLATVRDIISQIARGLQALHRKEMLHQDLRPENIIIDAQGTVKIIDFGSTRVAGLDETLTPATRAAVLGTLAFTAPEVFLDEPTSERSDQFSLGVIAYQLFSGRLPYGTQVSAVRSRSDLQRLAYRSVRSDRSPLPGWLDTVLMKATHPLAHKRYDALSELVHDLHHPPRHALQSQRTPLMQRHPLRVWQGLTLLFGLLALLLAAQLVRRSPLAGGHAMPRPAEASSMLPMRAHGSMTPS
jgi:serine/threonine protein kinase/serine/threonine protein phosphatase PrpC